MSLLKEHNYSQYPIETKKKVKHLNSQEVLYSCEYEALLLNHFQMIHNATVFFSNSIATAYIKVKELEMVVKHQEKLD